LLNPPVHLETDVSPQGNEESANGHSERERQNRVGKIRHRFTPRAGNGETVFQPSNATGVVQ